MRIPSIAAACAVFTVSLAQVSEAKNYVVTSNDDNEAVIETLRGAIADAIANGDAKNTITFNLPSNKRKISLKNKDALIVEPPAGVSIAINAVQSNGKPGVTIDAAGAPTGFVVFGIGNSISGFYITNFASSGIFLKAESRSTVVTNNWIGIAPGFKPNNRKNKNAPGILVHSSLNKITKNVIAGVHNGIHLGYDPDNRKSFGTAVKKNLIALNLIGTNSTGGKGAGNNSDGIFMGPKVSQNRILNNTVSGNDSAGIELLHGTVKNNILLKNKVGTNKRGSKVIGNGDIGIYIANSASKNIVGKKGSGNVVSGNKLVGIGLGPDGSRYVTAKSNTVEGNLIGCDAAGKKTLPGQRIGVQVGSVASSGNKIRNNTIGGNSEFGVLVQNCSNNQVSDNSVGIGKGGASIGNGAVGILLDRASGTFVSGNDVEFNGYGGSGGQYPSNGIFQLNSGGNTFVGNIVAKNRKN